MTGAIAETLRDYFGTTRIKFQFNSTVTGTTHAFQRTDELVREVINARTYGGMHFRSSSKHGAALGKSVARWNSDTTLQRRRH